MSKGSSPAGNTTTTQVNPTQQAQLPYLMGQPGGGINGWNGAVQLAGTDPNQYYPGQTLANFDPNMAGGYNAMIGAANENNQFNVPAADSAFYNAVGGDYGVANSPAYQGLQSVANDTSAPQNGLNWETQQLAGIGANAQGSGAGWAGALGALGQSAPQQMAQASTYLQGVLAPGALASGLSNAYAQTGVAQNATGETQGSANYINSLAPGAVGTASNYAGQLTNAANGAQGSVAPSISQLSGIAGSAGNNPALASLEATANGQYLNSNPNLAGEFSAAAQPVINAYQTATAPQTDSNFEASGRYGSGAQANAQSINQQNLGTALGNLSSNLYGQDYANERNLQTQAAGTLGNQYLGGLGASTSAAQAAGNLGLGASTAQMSGLANAGNLGLSGYTSGGNLAASGASTGLSGVAAELAGLGQAANTQATGYQNAGSLSSTGANAGLAGINTGLAGLSSAAGAQNAGYNSSTAASGAAGQLDLGDTNAANSALGTLQSGYQAGGTNAMQALALEPSVLSGGLTDANAIEQGGQGLTSMSQSQIQDAMNRFYGTQQAPWQTESQYMNLIGQPTSGSSQTTSPYFTNPLASLLGGGLGAASLSQSLTGQSLGNTLGLSSLFSGGGGGFAGGAAGSTAGLGFGAADGTAELGSVLGDFGGGGTALGVADSIAPEALAAAWIICTEMMRQGKMPKRHWIAGAPVFAAYPETVKNGYYLWAIPTVRHLRKRPDSLFSKTVGAAFRWRAENIAAYRGIRGARKLWRGAAVTAVLYPICKMLGYVASTQDWAALYREERPA